MRRGIILGIACLSLVVKSPAQIFGGGVVVCANCSNEPTSLVMKAQQALQYLKEAQTALRAIQMTQMMVTEGKLLAEHPSTNILADLSMLSTIAMQSQGLAGSMAQMDAQFRQIYGNYQGPDDLMTYAQKYNNWSNTTLQTLNNAMRTAGYQNGMLQNEQLWMAQIQAMNQMPMGRDSLLQLGNSIGTQEVAQLQNLRALMISDMTSKGAYTAQQVNTQQSAQSAQANAFTHADWVADQRSW